MNLLLAGRAVSQVFDGVKPLGDTGLVLRGIDTQTAIGFLSFHEAMRYANDLLAPHAWYDMLDLDGGS